MKGPGLFCPMVDIGLRFTVKTATRLVMRSPYKDDATEVAIQEAFKK